MEIFLDRSKVGRFIEAVFKAGLTLDREYKQFVYNAKVDVFREYVLSSAKLHFTLIMEYSSKNACFRN